MSYYSVVDNKKAQIMTVTIKTIETFNTYDIISKRDDHNVIHGRYGDKLICNKYRFKLSSVASYALDYNECPVNAAITASRRGEDLYYLAQLGLAINATEQDKKVFIEFSPGDALYFQGYIFQIDRRQHSKSHFTLTKICSEDEYKEFKYTTYCYM